MRTSAGYVVSLLVAGARAWSGTDGATCNFPAVDYLLWDHGAGTSATQTVGSLGLKTYYGGYSDGALAVRAYRARAAVCSAPLRGVAGVLEIVTHHKSVVSGASPA